MSDLAGLDIGWKGRGPRPSSTIREILCENGRRGQKNGKGYYTYDPETRAATPGPPKSTRPHQGLCRSRTVTSSVKCHGPGDPRATCSTRWSTKGAKILEEKIAIRGSDIDVVWVNGYGWPVYRGGPMHWADGVGLPEIVSKIEQYGGIARGTHWELSPLLGRLAADGGQLQTPHPADGPLGTHVTDPPSNEQRGRGAARGPVCGATPPASGDHRIRRDGAGQPHRARCDAGLRRRTGATVLRRVRRRRWLRPRRVGRDERARPPI